MRTLSIRQPWAWLIVHGHKDVENREWATDYRGPLLIHASKTAAKGEYAQQRDTIHEEMGILVPELEVIERGGFGSPTIFVGGEDMYFGNDRLPLVREAVLRRRRAA